MSEITVILGAYKGVQVKKQEVIVTEDEVMAELDRARTYAATSVDKSEGTAQMGDQAVIDFIGYINDEPFPGGDGKDYPLALGSNTFIPGFEDQLVGAKVGETVDVKVPFPENYHAQEYAGKDAVFKVTIKSLRSAIVPEMSDEIAAKISPCKTVAEFKEYIRQQITDYKADQALQEKENEVLTKVVEASKIEVPDEEVDQRMQMLKNNLIAQLRNSGNTLEDYLDYNNSTEEMLDSTMRINALNMLKGQAVLAAVAEEQGYTYTEAELEEELFKMARSYQMDVPGLKEMIGEEGMKMVGMDILHKRALDFITEQAVEI